MLTYEGSDWRNSFFWCIQSAHVDPAQPPARALPSAVALLGAGLDRATVPFMGWFGPRGLASIVLGPVYLQHETATEPCAPARRVLDPLERIAEVLVGLTIALGGRVFLTTLCRLHAAASATSAIARPRRRRTSASSPGAATITTLGTMGAK